MRCPYCNADHDRVLDSRSVQDGFVVRRRRECLGCKRRFTTYERLEELELKVVKKDGVREPFDVEKLRQGMARACWKRPISDEQIDLIISLVQQDIYTKFESEVDSAYLGELLMEHLRQLDQVAFVRFASVYREFKDVSDFVDELQMLHERAKTPR